MNKLAMLILYAHPPPTSVISNCHDALIHAGIPTVQTKNLIKRCKVYGQTAARAICHSGCYFSGSYCEEEGFSCISLIFDPLTNPSAETPTDAAGRSYSAQLGLED